MLTLFSVPRSVRPIALLLLLMLPLFVTAQDDPSELPDAIQQQLQDAQELAAPDSRETPADAGEQAQPEAGEPEQEQEAPAGEPLSGDEGEPAPEESEETEEPLPGEDERQAGETPAGDEPQTPDQPSQAQEPTASPDEVTVAQDGAVTAFLNGEELWRLDFPEGSGGTGALLELDDTVWVGHGNSVLAVNRDSGTVGKRLPLQGRVSRLDESATGISAVTELPGGVRQRAEFSQDTERTRVRFGMVPELFGWLEAEATVDDPIARLAQDPTNPYLHLAAALELEAGSSERNDRVTAAVQAGQTFYDLSRLARLLHAAGEEEAAQAAMDKALADFAERGYDPRLIAHARVYDLYNFPLTPLQEAVAAGDLEAARFWAPWMQLLASEEVPESREALLGFSALLEAQGHGDEARLWRDRARRSVSASSTASLDAFFMRLAGAGWYGVAAILAAIIGLHLTLVAKYWAPQSVTLRQRAQVGSRSRRPWLRLLSIRYYSFTEKLVLILLFAVLLVFLGLTAWDDRSQERPLALAGGTLAGPVAQVELDRLSPRGEHGQFLLGYAAHVSGEAQEAGQHYRAAGEYAPALNNLGVLEREESLYQSALEEAPNMAEPAYNLGRTGNPSPFHAAYRANTPLLAVPTETDFRLAQAGSWQGAIAATFTNPWLALRDIDFFGLPNWVWLVVLALLFVWIAVTVVWLLIPRPRYARNAPRSPVYHVLSVLIPGSGLADEAWGILLMLPWAVLGVDALAQALGWGNPLGLSQQTQLWALAAIYLINLVAVVIEFISYRRRMQELKREDPELYGTYLGRPS